MSHIIIGTAGHIDHGKSSLVKALTGTDPDRLIEEQERGMTIDLGFAFLNEQIAFIDVPGHEKFIKNMVAGVSTVDLVMLVIAADDGIMPQTREHLDILSLLDLKQGFIALTKIDLVEYDWLEMIKEDITKLVHGTFLESAPIVPVSTISGIGLSEVKQTIQSLVQEIKPRPDRGIFWMPIDRAFVIKGFGTVVTGSVLSGYCQVGDTLELLPAGKSVRIRGMQAHGKPTSLVQLGDRAALNLLNIPKEDIARGDVLVTAHMVQATELLDVKIKLLPHAPKTLSHRARVRLHLGTQEVMARIKLFDKQGLEPGATCFAQLMLEERIAALRRDRFVIRQYSPTVTIGGGIILDTLPKPHRRNDKAILAHLGNLEKQNPEELLEGVLLGQTLAPLSLAELAQKTGFKQEEVIPIMENLLQKDRILQIGSDKNPRYYHVSNFNLLKEKMRGTLEEFHRQEPLKPGISKAELYKSIQKGQINLHLLETVLSASHSDGIIMETGQVLKSANHVIQITEKDEQLAHQIQMQLCNAGFCTPSDEELADQLGYTVPEIRRILGAMQGLGRIVRLEGGIYYSSSQIEHAKKVIWKLGAGNRDISVGQFREALNTTRKYAMVLLAYFDQIGLTERYGEGRLLRSDAAR